ncbi:MAG: DUF4350 domain-containing protein [Gemmatimonadaceae bacterium]
MNDAKKSAVGPAPWWVRPMIVLPVLIGLSFVVALLTPEANGPRNGDARLSTLNNGPMGGRLLWDLSQRTGWVTERRLTPALETSPDIVYAVLSPAIDLRATEAHEFLEHARRGGALLISAGGGAGALMDSLHLETSTSGPIVESVRTTATCEAEAEADEADFTSLWFNFEPALWGLAWKAPAPSTPIEFVHVRIALDSVDSGGDKFEQRPAMLGFEYGAGRIVVASDPDLFRTDALRQCNTSFDVAAVRALEFLRGGSATVRARLVFDEFHQGHGAYPGSMGAAMRYFAGTPTGRFFATFTLAGIILLIALAPRLVPPAPDGRLERRSPVEQVDALARAYEQVDATQTAAQRLVRGLRRRVQRTTPSRDHIDDASWLERLAERVPALATDAALARRAISTSLPPDEFIELGPAIHRIESTLTRR